MMKQHNGATPASVNVTDVGVKLKSRSLGWMEGGPYFLRVTNTGSKNVYLALCDSINDAVTGLPVCSAVAGSGIVLIPGAAYELNNMNMCTCEVWAITTATETSTLAVQAGN